MTKLIEFIESFIPKHFMQDSGLVIRTKFLLFVLFLLGALALVYNLIYFKVGNPFGGSAIILTIFIVWSLPFYLRKTGNLEKTMNLCGAGLVFMNGVCTITSGGATFSGNPWWAVTPVFATLIVGGNAGKKWLLVVSLLMGGFYILEAFGFQFPNLISTAPENAMWVHFLDWFHFFGIVLVITVSSLVFDHINRQALLSELETRRKTEETSTQLEENNRYLDTNVERILCEMQKLAGGDLTSSLKILKDDEIGRLCNGFNQAVNRVHEVIVEVNQAAEVTVQESGLITDSTHHLSEGLQTQTGQADEIFNSTSQTVAIIAENARNARSTAEVAQQNGELAAHGGSVVGQTISKMEEINQVVDNSTKSIQLLGESTNDIGDIVLVIQEIASKTNLLALNAAIEAAHAGVAGRGFGVIAEEVKELANQTTAATEQIAKMIQGVQNRAKEVIDVMQVGNEQVNKGKELATQAGEALDQIVESSNNVSSLIQSIASASEEQSNQSEHLFKKIEELRTVMADSANEIHEITTSTDKTGKLTGHLQTLLTRFKVNA